MRLTHQVGAFAFSTGYAKDGLPEGFKHIGILGNPAARKRSSA